MTKRDFFIIIVRLFGLYSLILSVFSILPSNISFLAYAGKIDSFTMITTLLTLTIAFSLMVLLLFKADKVVSLLKLDNKFDEERIDLGKLNIESILKLGLIVVGGFLILDNIAWFLRDTLNAFKTDLSRQVLESSFKTNWIIEGVNLIIGILLITNLNSLSKFLSKKINE